MLYMITITDTIHTNCKKKKQIESYLTSMYATVITFKKRHVA
jgi:hypothetical protein